MEVDSLSSCGRRLHSYAASLAAEAKRKFAALITDLHNLNHHNVEATEKNKVQKSNLSQEAIAEIRADIHYFFLNYPEAEVEKSFGNYLEVGHIILPPVADHLK